MFDEFECDSMFMSQHPWLRPNGVLEYLGSHTGLGFQSCILCIQRQILYVNWLSVGCAMLTTDSSVLCVFVVGLEHEYLGGGCSLFVGVQRPYAHMHVCDVAGVNMPECDTTSAQG